MLSYAPIASIASIAPLAPLTPLVFSPCLTGPRVVEPMCSICGTQDLILPCLTCYRRQCETCVKSAYSLTECEGCRLERVLAMDEDTEFWNVREQEDEEDKEDKDAEEEPGLLPAPMVFEEFGPAHVSDPDYPQEYVEPGTMIFREIPYPTEDEWRYAGQVLESHILFTTSDAGPQQPHPYTKYLVGRVYYSSPTSITTDYMMSYEHDPRNPSKMIWIKYIATYYNQSPMPHEKNAFYPYPLPLRFYRI